MPPRVADLSSERVPRFAWTETLVTLRPMQRLPRR